MSNQLLVVNQCLGVTLKRLKNLIFLHVLAWALYESLVHMMKKVIFDNFLALFIVFDHANACASMCSLVENTQQTSHAHSSHPVLCWLWPCNHITKNMTSKCGVVLCIELCFYTIWTPITCLPHNLVEIEINQIVSFTMSEVVTTAKTLLLIVDIKINCL